jgi:hypothetical protein
MSPEQLFTDAIRSTKHETETKDLAFIDYCNALHSILHSWLIKFLQLYGCRKVLLNLTALYKSALFVTFKKRLKK